jgi:hypothetical protein
VAPWAMKMATFSPATEVTKAILEESQVISISTTAVRVSVVELEGRLMNYSPVPEAEHVTGRSSSALRASWRAAAKARLGIKGVKGNRVASGLGSRRLRNRMV